MQNFTHYDFSIGIPSRWADASVVIMVGPPNDNFSPNITIVREQIDFKLSATEYAANQLASLKDELSELNYQVVEESPRKLEGLDAYQRIHTFLEPNINAKVMQLQVYVIKNKEVITMTFTNLAHRFEQTKPSFLEALNNFKWKGTSD
jgi:hypothetical protein